MFVAIHSSADLGLTTPLTQCCNCGARRGLALAATPMRRTRYLLLAGTEFSLNETFPYCPACKASAARAPGGWMHRALVWAMLAAAALVALLVAPQGAMTAWVGGHVFLAAGVLALLPMAAWYGLWARDTARRAWYQPVRLLALDATGDRIARVRLWFFNAAYAREIAAANAPLVNAGLLEIDTGGR